MFLLRHANEVWGKVMFLHLCVILFTGGLHSRRGVCIQGGGSASGMRVCIQGRLGTPPLDTTGHGQRAGGTPPTGIHSCLTADHFYYKTRTVKFGVNTEQIDVFFIINEVQKGHSDTNI